MTTPETRRESPETHPDTMAKATIAAVRSGGQSGADRGAMDAALACGVPVVGWCPAGGWAEDFPEPPGVMALYPNMVETPSREPIQRTEWNIRDSTCTMVFRASDRGVSPGTEAGNVFNEVYGVPCFDFQLGDEGTYAQQVDCAFAWLCELGGNIVIGIGGPRESEYPGMHDLAFALVKSLLEKFGG